MECYNGLTESDVQHLRDTLGEDPSKTKAYIISMRRWLSTQGHLSCTDDGDFLLKFLRVAKFDTHRAQVMIDNFCTLRLTKAPTWNTFRGLDDVKMQELLEAGYIIHLGESESGCPVVLFRAGVWDPDAVPFDDKMAFLNAMLDVITFRNSFAQMYGVVVIIDFTDFQRKHSNCWNREQIAKLMMMQDSIPVRIAQLHYYKTSVLFNSLFEVIKMFMKDDIREKILWHKDSIDSLKEHFSQSMLPSEYSGDGGPISVYIEKWNNEFTNMVGNISFLRDMKVDESMRPPDTLNYFQSYVNNGQ